MRTHTGEEITGPQLTSALNAGADDWENLACAIRGEDLYASHVTEAQKDQYLAEMLERAEAIRRGEIESFTIWQRVNEKLTGRCVPFLPK